MTTKTPKLVLYTGINRVPNVWCHDCDRLVETGRTHDATRLWSEVSAAVQAHVCEFHEGSAMPGRGY